MENEKNTQENEVLIESEAENEVEVEDEDEDEDEDEVKAEAGAESENENNEDEEDEEDVIYENPLEASLDNASPEQLGEKSRKRVSTSRIIALCARLLIISALLCVVVYSGYMIVTRLSEYDESQALYTDLAERFASDTPSLTDVLESPEDDIYLPDFQSMLAGDFEYKPIVTDEEKRSRALYRTKIQALSEINSDVFGWINIPGTNIDYPIVLGSDNQRYVDYDFYGNESSLGAIFADFRCETTVTDNKNLVIYGHNIRTRGVMFNHLLRYLDRDFFEDNEYIYIYTADGSYKFRIFSFYQTTTSYNYTKVYFIDDASFTGFCGEVRDKSLFSRKGDMNFTPDSMILTLSTCTNGASNERYALHAVLVESSTDQTK